MKIKIIGLLVSMLLIATTLPAIGVGIEEKQPLDTLSDNLQSIKTPIKPTTMVEIPEVEWKKTFDNGEFDMFRGVHETTDGGFIVGGMREVSNIFYPWVVKLDADGNEVWNWTIEEIEYNGTIYEIRDSFLPYIHYYETDQLYLICSMIAIYNNDTSLIEWGGALLKFDEMGYVNITPVFYELDAWWFLPEAMCEIDDGFIITGFGNDYVIPNNIQAGLIKTDFSGNVLWHQFYDYDNGDDEAYGICATSDGFILSGTVHYNTPNQDCWLIKTDVNGNKIWDKIYGGSKSEQSFSPCLFETTDGGYLMGTWGSSDMGAGNQELWIIKTDANGTILWNETYGSQKNEATWCMNRAPDDGFVFLVTHDWMGIDYDIWVIRTDEDANAIWKLAIDDPALKEVGQQIHPTSDGGYIITGRTGAHPDPNSDALIIKLSPEGENPAQPTMKTHPRPGWIYFLNLFGLPFPLTTDALILGQSLTFKAQVDDAQVVDKVEYFIDGLVVGETNETAGLLKTYNYLWEDAEKGSYNLKIRGYNTYGGTCKEELTIRKLI